MKFATETFYTESLASGLSDFWLKIYQAYLNQLQKAWQKECDKANCQTNADRLLIGLNEINQSLATIEHRLTLLRSRQQIFMAEISQETNEDNRHNLILEFCRFLGGSNLKGDKKALNRWLDEQAVTERWHSVVKDLEFEVSFLTGRLAALFDLLAFSPEKPDTLVCWHDLKIEQNITPWMRYAFEPKVQLAAFKTISSTLKSIQGDTPHLLSSELLRYTYRFALDNRQQPELQIEALNLLAVADLNKAVNLIQTRLSREAEDDQIFFREAIAELICLHYLNKPDIFELTTPLLEDGSPLVRQSVIQTLAICDDEQRVQDMLGSLSKDPSDAVYCQLVTQIPYLVLPKQCNEFYVEQLTQPQSVLRYRALFRGLLSGLTLLNLQSTAFNVLYQQLESSLTDISVTSIVPKVQYWALETREKIWCVKQKHLTSQLSPLLREPHVVKKKLTKEQVELIASGEGKRWLAANIGHRFSMQISGRHLYQGERFGLRLWRFWYELINPATDKRQHHSHVNGRLYFEQDLIPSATLSEVSATTVPGEPLHFDKEGHWRPFLPLVDQLISAIDNTRGGREMVIHHVSGQTVIKPPKSFWQRQKARVSLTFRFKRYAALRNVDFDGETPGAYIAAMTRLGFEISHNRHVLETTNQIAPAAPSVARFFELAIPLSLIQFYQDFQRYFVSVYQNTIQHILIFTLVMVGVFWGNHLIVSERVKRARKHIPMTIGGWGTRGKSGTERLKAALVNSVGLSTVSKTTGCEAMFLYATRYGVLKEMFLFRPYDKATIWEQTFVARLTAKLKSDVLCWECMGLTPRYIDILQQQWMRDDMITITNCFPDHEDLQGPAGIDVPQVIAKFIAPKSRVWTTEDNMLAYLEQEAARKDANLTAVDWLDIATIPEDLLTRFPYEEHPANIALVAKMAAELQLNRTMAIKEMADRVVADIGVLQVFPFANINGRQIRFINGMSANERYGALANWQRLHYEEDGPRLHNQYQLVTVINNRADRVPRSKVFARLIAYDFSSSLHFVIGNNLDGFQSFATEYWQERLDKTFTSNMSVREFNQHRQTLMDFLVVPDSDASLRTYLQCFTLSDAQLEALLQTAAHDAQLPQQLSSEQASLMAGMSSETQSFIAMLIKASRECQALGDQVAGQEQVSADAIRQTKAVFKRVFLQKLVVVQDYHITGPQLCDTIARSLPAGVNIDVLGLQNIKGPGLDFVYTWQQWQNIHGLMDKITAAFNEEMEALINELSAYTSFSCLDREALEAFLEEHLHSDKSRLDSYLTQLKQIKATLITSGSVEKSSARGTNYWGAVLYILEEIFDVFDAVVRGRQAKRILIDLAAKRISLNKAAWLLKRINKRQKGGWLGQ